MEAKPEESKEKIDVNAPIEIDPRNFEENIGFIDVMGFKITNTKNRIESSWQNLWIRYATDQDKKSEATKGKDSRFYKFSLSKVHKKGIGKADKFDKHKFAKEKVI